MKGSLFVRSGVPDGECKSVGDRPDDSGVDKLQGIARRPLPIQPFQSTPASFATSSAVRP